MFLRVLSPKGSSSSLSFQSISLFLRVSPPKGREEGVDDAALAIGCFSLELVAPRFLCTSGFLPPREAGAASMMPRSPAGVKRQ